MANPQKEKGYIPIANEIAEKLCKINLSSYQYRLLWCVWRKTYGWNKSDDWIANSQIIEITNLKKQHVSRTKKQLITKKILVTSKDDKIKFNKNYSQWIELPKSVTTKRVTNLGEKLPEKVTNVTRTGGHNNTLYKRKEIYKESFFNYGSHVSITEKKYNEFCEDYGKAQIDSIIEDVNNYCEAHGKTYKRYAGAINSFLKKAGITKRIDLDKIGDDIAIAKWLQKNPTHAEQVKNEKPTAYHLSQFI